MKRPNHTTQCRIPLRASRPPLGRTHRAGLGLIEVICATMIVGLMLVASLEVVGAVFRTQRLNADRLTGPNLAMELMTEILSMPYEDPEVDNTDIGTEAAESAVTRVDFDDVDDYHGWNKVGLQTKTGANNANFSTWRRQVAVEWVAIADGTASASSTDLKRITVTVTSPSGDVTRLVAYRAKEGMLEQSPALEMTAVTWMGANLQLGADNTPATVGKNLPNHAADVD